MELSRKSPLFILTTYTEPLHLVKNSFLIL